MIYSVCRILWYYTPTKDLAIILKIPPNLTALENTL